MEEQSATGSLIALLISLKGAGCASRPPEPSGFLSDYSNLAAHPIRRGAKFYENQMTPQEGNDKCIIDPTSICVGPTRSGVALRGDVVSFLEERIQS